MSRAVFSGASVRTVKNSASSTSTCNVGRTHKVHPNAVSPPLGLRCSLRAGWDTLAQHHHDHLPKTPVKETRMDVDIWIHDSLLTQFATPPRVIRGFLCKKANILTMFCVSVTSCGKTRSSRSSRLLSSVDFNRTNLRTRGIVFAVDTHLTLSLLDVSDVRHEVPMPFRPVCQLTRNASRNPVGSMFIQSSFFLVVLVIIKTLDGCFQFRSWFLA